MVPLVLLLVERESRTGSQDQGNLSLCDKVTMTLEVWSRWGFQMAVVVYQWLCMELG